MLLFARFLQATEENVEKEPNQMQEDMVAESAAVSQKVNHNSEEEKSKEGTSLNISGSSDMVCGTPQKLPSRRQSFITLETYSDGKSTSPGVTSTFTGPHTKITSSQNNTMTDKSNSPMESQGSTESKSQDFLSVGKKNSQCGVSQTPESPLRPKESLTKYEPVRLTERMSSGPAEEDDVIPDTQTDAKGEETAKVAQVQPSGQEETPQPNLDDSQSPWNKISPGGPRRSGRHRVPPTLPGEDPDDRDSKYTQFKQKTPGDHLKSDSQNSDSSQNGPKTRSRQAAEEEETGKHRLRTRSQRDQASSSQTPSQSKTKKIKLYSNSEQVLEKIERPESRRRSRDSSQTGVQSGKESQPQGRHSRRSKGSPRSKEEGEMEVSEKSQESSQDESTSDAQAASPGTTALTQECKGTVDNETSKEDSQVTTLSPEDSRRNSQLVTPPSSNKSLQIGGDTSQLTHTEVKKMLNDTSEDCPGLGEDSPLNKSKVQSGAASETEDVDERQNTSNSQITPAEKKETTVGVRTRSKAAVPAQEGSLSTPESSQSQSLEESTDFSQGRSRYSRRRSSQPLASLESSESETTAPTENIHMPKKRGRKPRASLQSTPTGKSPENERNDGSDHDRSLRAEHERVDDSQQTHHLQDSESLRESQTEEKAAAAAAPAKATTDGGGETALENTSLQEEKQIPTKANTDHVSHEPGTTELQSSEKCESLGNDAEQTQTCSLVELSAAAEPGDGDGDERKSLDQAHPVDPSEACHTAALVETQMDGLRGSDEAKDEGQKNELAEPGDETTDEKHVVQMEDCKEEEQAIGEDAVDTSDVFSPAVIPESAIRDAGSPSKLKDLEALMGPDVNHSPSSRVRGTWSPSASPSTSILKKGQKRALEDETPSPLLKVSNQSRDSSRA